MDADGPMITWGRRIGSLLLAGVFGYAAVLKLLDPQAFASDIDRFRLLPYSLTLGLSVFLPWLELTCAMAVAFRWKERGALGVLLALCLMFTLALATAWFRGLDISCGCFGSHGSGSLVFGLLRALVLGALAYILWSSATGYPASAALPKSQLNPNGEGS
jgi:putative oxidoreductase